MQEIVLKLKRLITQSRVDLSSEKAAQSDLESLLKNNQIDYRREYRLSKLDIIDFMVDAVGIEVKLRGSNKKSVYKQLCRYALHDEIHCLILVSNLNMGLPNEIYGKDVYFINLGEGWL